jgi:hypothetical protein
MITHRNYRYHIYRQYVHARNQRKALPTQTPRAPSLRRLERQHFPVNKGAVNRVNCVLVLKPGDRWVLHMPNGNSPFGRPARYRDLTHELAFTRTSLSQLLPSSGFSSVNCFRDTLSITSRRARCAGRSGRRFVAHCDSTSRRDGRCAHLFAEYVRGGDG